MPDKKDEIKKGIKFHEIETNKFKTNLFAIFLTVPLKRETVTKNALLAATLRRGTMEFPTQEQISKELEEMYGASFDCGIEKTGGGTYGYPIRPNATEGTVEYCGGAETGQRTV